MFRWLTERRRRHLLEGPFPSPWHQYLQSRVAAYALLDDEQRQRLRDLVRVFIAEKRWEGCGGLDLTDEIRVTIAASACLLLLGRDHDLFADVESILVYPRTVVVPAQAPSIFHTSGLPAEPETPIMGQAFRHGPVVLAWDAVMSGAGNTRDGRNVVIHEFAHKVDFLDGAADGTPPLPNQASRQAWSHALTPAFLRLKQRVGQQRHGFLDDYAATNEAEFFAVVSEVFFEKPDVLAKALPDVHAALRDFYGIELAGRTSRR